MLKLKLKLKLQAQAGPKQTLPALPSPRSIFKVTTMKLPVKAIEWKASAPSLLIMINDSDADATGAGSCADDGCGSSWELP